MNRQQMKLSANQFWYKKLSGIVTFLTLSSSLFCSEPEYKKVKFNSQENDGGSLPISSMSNDDPEETSFGRWLQDNQQELRKVRALTSLRNEKRSKELTAAGILYLASLSAEIQGYIAQYVIPSLSPTTLGVHKNDLYYTLGQNHNNPPFIQHTGIHNTILCSQDSDCKKRQIALDSGYFKNKSLSNAPSKISYLWDLVKSEKALPTPIMLIVDMPNQKLLTGHESDTTKPKPNAPTYEWKFKNPCQNAIKLSKHTSGLTIRDILALKVADNRLKEKNCTVKLTEESLKIMKRIKQNIGTLSTNPDGSSVRPIFVEDDFDPKKKKFLQRQNAFYRKYPESFEE